MGLIDGASGLGGGYYTSIRRHCVGGPSVASPVGHVESAGGINAIDGDVLIRQRDSGLACLGRAWGLQEVHGAVADYGPVSLCIEKKGSLLVDGYVAWEIRPAIVVDAAEKSEVASHAIARDEVGIVNESLQDGNVDEVLAQCDVPGIGIRQCLRGRDTLARQSCVNELGEDVHSGTGAADRHALSDQGVQRALHRCALPEVYVVGLIAAGNPERLSMLDLVEDERIVVGGAFGNDESGNRVFVGAELLDVGIVGVGSCRADYEEVSVAAALAHPLEGCVDVGTSAHEHGACGCGGSDVGGIADAKIGILFCGERGTGERQGEQKKSDGSH
jgi:hypothetical protein